jgi:diketogulonate reductase-like aldo/keto reductase
MMSYSKNESALRQPVLGVWQSKKGEVGDAVKVRLLYHSHFFFLRCPQAALKTGYTHIDGAWIYGNELEVGEAIKESGFSREKIWLTSKVTMFHFFQLVPGL